MSAKNLKQVMRNIRKVVHHMSVFEGSFPKILTGTREYTRSHLVVVKDSLPDLKRLVRYAMETVPAVARMVGVVGKGASDLTQVTSTLREVRRSTEAAVNEILEVLDRVDPLLEEAAKAEGANGKSRELLEEARGELTLILNSLQFQDITAQRIEGTNALLASLGEGLVTLVEGLGEQMDESMQIEVAEGTFDPNATFDRKRAGVVQEDIDQLLEGNGKSDVPQADIDGLVAANADGGQDKAEGASKTDSEVVSQDDIDALINM